MFPNTAANSLSLHSVQQTQALSAHPLHLHDGGTAHSWRAACISVVIRAIRVGYSLCALLTCSQAGSSSSWTKHLAAGNSPIITVILKFQRQWCDEINGFGPRLPTRARISVKGEKKKTFKQLLQRVPFGLHYYNLTGLTRSKVEEPPSPLPFPLAVSIIVALHICNASAEPSVPGASLFQALHKHSLGCPRLSSATG